MEKSLKTISVVMMLVLAAKISGLIRDVLILRYLGTTADAQAFTLASQIPRNFMDAAFAAAISASFIPVFNSYLERKTKGEAFALANNFITLMMILALTASIIGFLVAGPIAAAHLMSEGGAESAALMGNLLRIMIFTIFTTTTAFAFIGVLQSLGGFYIPSIMSLVPNAIVLLYLLLFLDRFGVYGLAIAFMIGNILQIAIFVPPLRKRKFVFRPVVALRDPGLRQILRLTPMVLVSAWLFPINNLVNNALLSNHRPEAVVELNVANTLYLVVTGFFVLSVTNVLFPKLSREAAKDKSLFASTLASGLSGVTFILLPMAVGLWILREPILHLIYYGGELTAAEIQSASHAMGFLIIGMLGFGLFTILSRAFFALMDGKTPMITSVAAIALNLAATLLLMNQMDIAAPALASALSVTAAGIVMLIVMARRFPIVSVQGTGNFCKMIVAALAMGGCLFAVSRIISGLPAVFYIGIICLLGIVIYFSIGLMLKISEAKTAQSLIVSKLRRNS